MSSSRRLASRPDAAEASLLQQEGQVIFIGTSDPYWLERSGTSLIQQVHEAGN